MDTRMVVKAELRTAMDGELPAKALETPNVPARRLWKAADLEEIKDFRVWELREVLPNALRADPIAALNFLSDLLGLRDAGVIVALAPSATAGAHDLVVESAEAMVATAQVQAAALRAAADGDINPEEAEEIEAAKRAAERELLQVGVLAARFQEPQGRLLAHGARACR